MKHIKTYQLFESKVDDKIQLLKDLVLELQDAGLQVEVINGSHSYLLRDPRVSIHTGSRYTNDYKNFIIVTITDINNRFNTDLFNTDIIDEFKETLKSYGMNPRGMSGGRNFCVFKFDKWSKMTDSPILKESVHDTKEEIEEIVSTCKDILLEANDTFSSNSNVEKSYKDDKLTITCAYTVPFNTKVKVEEYKSSMNDIHGRLIEYMTSQGFTYNNRGDESTDYFDIVLGSITYNISFSKELDKEFIGHLRYLRKYNLLKESTEQDLKDILLELQDEGYRVLHNDDVLLAVTGEPSNIKAIVVRDVMKPSEWAELPWSELKEYALRIKDYLGDKYLSFQWRKVVNDKTSDNPYKTIELNDDTEINDRVWSFVIKYKE